MNCNSSYAYGFGFGFGFGLGFGFGFGFGFEQRHWVTVGPSVSVSEGSPMIRNLYANL